MPVTVGMPGFQNHEAPISALANLAGVASNIYHNSKANDLIKAQTANEELKNQASQLQMGQNQDLQKSLSDPNSPQTKTTKLMSNTYIQGLKGTGLFNSEEGQSALQNLVDNINDPQTSGLQVHQLFEANPLSKAITGLGEAQAKANSFAGLVKVKGDQLDETRNKNATLVGHEYENDPIIKNSKVKMNSMAQSGSILTNPNKPVLANDFAAAYQDYLAGTTPGGAPTEGKAHREIPDTFEQQWNSVKSRLGKNDDMRNDPQGAMLISNLQKNIATSVGELKSQVADQATSLHSNYLNSSNPKVAETNERKFRQYAPPQSSQSSAPAAQGQKAPPGGNMTVQQNGHTYNWNSMTGNYE